MKMLVAKEFTIHVDPSDNPDPDTHLESFQFQCGSCEYRSKWLLSVKRHQQSIHSSQSKLKCDQCDFKTTRQNNLNNHKASVHEGCVLRCDLCNFTTAWKSTLRRHVQSKHELMRYTCDKPDCQFTSSRQENLETHQKVAHDGSSQFKCLHCDFQSKWQANLTRHIAGVHNQTRFSCGKCAFGATNSQLLKAHVARMHATSHSFRCEFCKYSASVKNNLTRHVKRHHPQEYQKRRNNISDQNLQSDINNLSKSNLSSLSDDTGGEMVENS